MYSALQIAEYVIKYSTSQRVPVSNLRLQKVLYFIQAEFLVSKNSPCFNDRIEAWGLGPVIPTVYRKYKIFGASSIPVPNITNAGRGISKEDIELINEMVDQCNHYSTSSLVEITHKQSPWIKAYNSCFSKEMSHKSIREYFKEE